MTSAGTLLAPQSVVIDSPFPMKLSHPASLAGRWGRPEAHLDYQQRACRRSSMIPARNRLHPDCAYCPAGTPGLLYWWTISACLSNRLGTPARSSSRLSRLPALTHWPSVLVHPRSHEFRCGLRLVALETAQPLLAAWLGELGFHFVALHFMSL